MTCLLLLLVPQCLLVTRHAGGAGRSQLIRQAKSRQDQNRCIAAQHHRKLGFKSELGGRSRAKAGIMQRISMVALRATARQVIRGVALVGAANVQAHSDRRAEKTAEAAKYDAFGPNHGGAFRPFDCGRTA